jgi:putative ABC transport system permease protein
MRLASLPFKSAIVSWWRSLTLGTFVFILCFSLVFFQSVTETADKTMENAVTDCLTGHIQARPQITTEKDMADVMKTSWEALPSFLPRETDSIVRSMKKMLSQAEIIPRIRSNLILVSDKDKIPAMTIGVDPGTESYKKGFILTIGHYVEKADEIIITEKDASVLGVKAGDTIGALAITAEGYTSDGAFVVSGIGNLRMLGMFGMSLAYCSREGLASVLGTDKDAATEVIAILPESKKTQAMEASLRKNIEEGIACKITDFHAMGGFVMGVASGTAIFFYGMLSVLMLIMGILIANLVFLSCLERYKEIATFRALGFSRFKVASLFMVEIFIITGFFGGLGILFAILTVLYFGHAGFPALSAAWEFSMGKKLYLVFQPENIALVIIIATLFIFCASLYPALRAVKMRVADSLKED